VFSRFSNNLRTLEQLDKIIGRLQLLEKKYGTIGELSRIAKGDNAQRLTFERYVLAAYFDEIITAANHRLERMTSSRYLLQRKEDKSKGRAQQGLELEVFDNYTGKSRHVKTLSGGEGFKASLALALGLADVVQFYSGGISLDTLFVDEGFGSLDPESLDSAIQCLADIQKTGRLVGVISHVVELKERIKSSLEIISKKEGSFVLINV
jgi:exonuclease SbcC